MANTGTTALARSVSFSVGELRLYLEDQVLTAVDQTIKSEPFVENVLACSCENIHYNTEMNIYLRINNGPLSGVR